METNSPKRFERKPNLELNTKLSKDGRYWIIRRTETWILPRKYLEVISAGTAPDGPKATDPANTVNVTALPTGTKPEETVLPTGSIPPKNSKKGKRDVDGNG